MEKMDEKSSTFNHKRTLFFLADDNFEKKNEKNLNSNFEMEKKSKNRRKSCGAAGFPSKGSLLSKGKSKSLPELFAKIPDAFPDQIPNTNAQIWNNNGTQITNAFSDQITNVDGNQITNLSADGQILKVKNY